MSSVCSANCGARVIVGGVSSNCTGLATSWRSFPSASVTGGGSRWRSICGSSATSSGFWIGAHWPSIVCRCSTQYGVRLLRDRLGDVLARLVGVRHEPLGGAEALVLEEVLEAEVLAHVGEVAAGLQHGEVDPAAVGGPEVADDRVHREVHAARRAARGGITSPVSIALSTRQRHRPGADAHQRHVDDRRLTGALPREQRGRDAAGDRHAADRVAVRARRAGR